MQKRTQLIHPNICKSLNLTFPEDPFSLKEEADSNTNFHDPPTEKFLPHPQLTNVFPPGFFPQPTKSFKKNCEDQLINVRYRDKEYWLNTKHVYKNNELKTLLLKDDLVLIPEHRRTTTSFSFSNSQFNYAPSSVEENNQRPIKDFRWVNFEDWNLFALVYAPHSEYPLLPIQNPI